LPQDDSTGQPSDASKDGQPKQKETPKEIVEAFAEILKIAPNLIAEYYKEKRKDEMNTLQAMSRHNRKLVYILLTFAGLVIITMSVLTFYEKVSGDALLFAVGSAVGYIFAMVHKLLFGTGAINNNSQESP